MNTIQEFYKKHGYKNEDIAIGALTSPMEKAVFNWYLKNTKLAVQNSSFFEIACGSGSFFNFLRQNNVKNYIGCDIGDWPIAQFKKLFPEEKDKIIQGDVLSILKKCSDEKFDCIVAMNILEHIDGEALLEIFGIVGQKLKKDGEFWIYAPAAESITSIFIRYGDFTHKRLFTLKGIEEIGGIFNLRKAAVSGKIVPIINLKYFARFLHNKLIYWLNRCLFAFNIGLRKNLGVFSDEIIIILRKQ